MRKKWNPLVRKILFLSLASVLVLGGCGPKQNENPVSTDTPSSAIQAESESPVNNDMSVEVEQSSTTESSTKADVLPALAELEVHFIDVGQGDATLFMCDGHYMLIDAGDNTMGTKVQMYLEKRGIEKLDYLILTHTDSDHIGGADVVVSKFDIDTIFLGDYKKDNKTYNDLMNEISYKSLTYSTPTVGSTYSMGDVNFTILAPNREYDDPNNNSISLLVTHGENSFLFSGDCEEEAELDILANGLSLDCDVYKVGHHGSRSSSSQDFLNAMTPTYGVISCEEGNSYGHPHSATLNSLRAMGVKIFRTDEQGSIVAYSDGVELTWNCAPTDSWQAGEPTQNSQTGNSATNSSTSSDATENSDDAGTDEPPASDITYVLNIKSMKFHKPSCRSLPSDANRKDVTLSRDEVINQGYSACGVCKP